MKYDLIVIGAGSGGLGAAMGMNKLGFKVLLIDKKAENIGGECLNTGCVPSKALLHVTKEIHSARKSRRFGLDINGIVDIDKVKDYIQQKQEKIRIHENVDFLQEEGIEVVLGTAAFTGRKELKVDNRVYKAGNIIIATGSSPRTIDIPGADALPVYTNESLFDIDFIPQNFVFIGAGPVSMEMAQAFSRLGSKVNVIVRGERILKKEDQEFSEILFKKLQEEGIDFYFHSEVKEIKGSKNALLKTSSGEEKLLPVDAIFMGLGRTLDFSSLDLDKAGVEMKEGKIVLNERLQTSNRNIFVSGDAADNLKFSHAAELHNMLLINNFLFPKKKQLNFDHFPWVTFTDPEVATFGLNEKKLKEKKIKYELLETHFDAVDRAVTDDYEYGKIILFIEKKSINPSNARILGGSIVAPNAGEIAQELILANVSGIKLQKFMDKIYPYPTAGNINKVLARNRILKEISPWMKRLLRTWYRLKE